MDDDQLRQLEVGTTFHLTWLGPGLFRIENNDVYTDLLVGEYRALLWDTGYGYDDLYTLVRKITVLPLYVINSHGHVDHCCGNWQFQEVFIHPEDMDLCREHTSMQMRQSTLNDAVLPDRFYPEDYLCKDAGWLRPVYEGDVFDLGGKTLEVIALPGHTAGSIGLHYKEERAVYVGDAVNNFVWLFLPEAMTLDVYRKTLQSLLNLDFDWMIQSHHPEVLPKDRLQYYLDLVDHLDFDNGETVPAPGMPDHTAKICIRNSMTLADRDQTEFAAILISADKLKPSE